MRYDADLTGAAELSMEKQEGFQTYLGGKIKELDKTMKGREKERLGESLGIRYDIMDAHSKKQTV